MNLHSPKGFEAASAAAEFVKARRAATALPGYPGPIPTRLADSYACQDAAIDLWGDRIVGWKVGLISPEIASDPGVGRLAGPIFAKQVQRAGTGVADFPVFVGGFAAVEAEFVLRLGVHAPAGKTDWTQDAARELVEAMHFGIETAGSPLATINDLGPTVVASDFGNNAGLILGGEIEGWRERSLASLVAETQIDGAVVGRGDGASVPGGPFEALRFLLELQARRGRPLKAGDLISTGAATGIHVIVERQTAQARFGRDGTIRCRAVKAVGS